MDPVGLVLVPGLLGGLVIAWSILKLQRRGTGHTADPFRGSSTDVINMAHIRVALGGAVPVVGSRTP